MIKKKKLSKSEESSLKSGLIIENAIKISYNKNSIIINTILLIFIAFLGVFGTIFSFISLFNMEVAVNSVVIYTLIFFTIFSVISILPDKALLMIFPLLALYLYIFMDYIQEFILGFKIVSNSISSVIFSAGLWSSYYEIPSNIIQYEYMTLFLVFCIFLLTGLICLFTIKLQSCVICFALTFPFIECGLYFGAVPNYIAFFMVVSYWIALLSMALAGCKKSTKNKSAGFVRVGNSFFAKSDCNFRVSEKIGLSTIIMCLVCILISSSFVSLSGYERSNKINDIRSDIKSAVNDFSLEDASYTLSRLGNMLSSGDNGSFNGTLGQKDKVEYKNVEKLSITTSEIPKNDIYLKGYVGSTYTGNSWDTLDKKSYDTEMLNEFERDGIYPQSLFFVQMELIYSKYSMTVSPVNKNSKVTFVPYYSSMNEDYSYIYDTTIKAKNNKEYSFIVLDTTVDNIPLELSVNSNFNNTSYREFVDKYYLTVQDNSAMESVQKLFSDYLYNTYNLDFDTFKSSADLYTKLDYIRTFLCSQYDYTLSPGKTPLDMDYILYFLSESKKGYCSHFASAGTMLCRMLDIPARYVEGYYVSTNEFTSNTFDGENYTVSVKDNVAHAWTEVYLDNIGWINVEFTPGFNGNPTKADFINQNSPNDNQDDTQTAETSQPMETQIAPVSDVPSDVTTAPQDSSNPNEVTTTTEDTTQLEEKPPIISPETLKKIKHILIIILSMALIIVLIIFRRRYILQKRMEKISNEDNKVSVLESYRYITQIFKYLGFIRKDTTPYMSFAQEVSLSLEYAKDFPNVMSLVLKSNLSENGVSNEERLIINDFVNNLINTVYEEQSKVRKLIVKYILCLI